VKTAVARILIHRSLLYDDRIAFDGADTVTCNGCKPEAISLTKACAGSNLAVKDNAVSSPL